MEGKRIGRGVLKRFITVALLLSYLMPATTVTAEIQKILIPLTVTSPGNSGTGTLRGAIAIVNANTNPNNSYTITFPVAENADQTISLSSGLTISGANVTIDALSSRYAVTLTGKSLEITGHDIKVFGLYINNVGSVTAQDDCVTIGSASSGANTFNILMEHNSIRDCGDGAIDVVQGAHDVDIRWNILGPGPNNGPGTPDDKKTSLAGENQALRVHYDHNFFYQGSDRHPKASWDTCPKPGVCPTT